MHPDKEKLTGGYAWAPPLCGEGDTVVAQPHKGIVSRAIVWMVETHYDLNRVAYHTYYVRFYGHIRNQRIWAHQIIEVITDAARLALKGQDHD